MKNTILSTQDLSIGYGKTTIKRNINISAPSGVLISLVGRNGYGKSTLLRTIAGLQLPLAGVVELNGKNISEISDNERSKLLSLVLTERISVDNLTVFDLVSFGRYPYTSWNGSLGNEDIAIVEDALKKVHIWHIRDKMISQTSDGEKQRAVIAKALAQETPLVLLDEPTSHLDLSNRIDIMLLLRKLASETGKTFILSSHELDLAVKMSDYLWIMQEDKITTGLPEDLLMDGVFQKAFSSEVFNFDTEDGHYQIVSQPTKKSVCIRGLTTTDKARWLRRAFIRCGIAENPTANKCVEVLEDRFVFDDKKSAFIEDVIRWALSD